MASRAFTVSIAFAPARPAQIWRRPFHHSVSLILFRKSSDLVFAGKVVRFSHNFFKFLYFTIVSIYAYNLLSEEKFFPAELGGFEAARITSVASERHPEDSLFKLSMAESDLISPNALAFVKSYFSLSTGFQLSNLYFLLAESQHADTWETLVQVALALELITYGFMAKHLAIGSCLLWMHDVCDILTSACKALVYTSCKVTSFMGAMVLMVVWAYSRLYCLGKLILLPLLREIEDRRPWRDGNIESLMFVIFLLLLYFMNIYW